MSDTIGDMVDKLTIANIRLWMLEDARREYCNTSESKTEEEIKDFLLSACTHSPLIKLLCFINF